MPGKIFVSYRRDDDAAAAARVADGLAARFGRGNVFMDVDHLLPGQRFDQKLAEALAECDVLIAVIGPRWMDLLRERTAGRATDYVRQEIAEALRRGIVVIPVRVGRVDRLPPLPGREDLPEDIRDLALHQSHDVTHEHFGGDLGKLIQAVVELRRRRPGRRTGVPWRWVGVGAVGVAAIVLAAVFIPRGGGGQPPPPANADATAAKERERLALLKKRQEEERKLGEEAAAIKERERLALLRKQQEEKRKTEEEARRDPALSIKPGSGESFRDRLADGRPCAECPEMVVVPAGSFTMGSPPEEVNGLSSERPQRRVTIARPFAVGKFEVTFAEWDACLADGGCSHRPEYRGWGRGKLPVINVSWDDITGEYLPWLSRKTGKTYRLLTEAEWEYVARAGTTTPFWWGTSISPSQANYNGGLTYGGGPKGEYRRRTVPVDSFAPNPWGLHNVHGNVWEWVQDCYHDSYSGAPADGSAWTTGDCGRRVVRGGAWFYSPSVLRSACRNGYPTVLRVNYLGFRLARPL